MLTRTLAVLSLMAIVISVACDDDSEVLPKGGSPSPTVTADVITSPAATPDEVVRSDEPPYQLGKSLRTLVENFQVVIVGKVQGVRGQYENSVIGPDGSILSTWPTSVLDIKVERVINSTRVNEGETIAFHQTGGVLPDGRTFVSATAGRLLKEGSSYLFFLQDLMPFADGFGGPGFARFEVIDGKIPPNGGEALPAVAAITGFNYDEVRDAKYAEDSEAQLQSMAKRTIEDVAATITAAINEAPLPPPYTPAPDRTAPPIQPVPTP